MLALDRIGRVFVAGANGFLAFGRDPFALVGAQACVEVFLLFLFEPPLLRDEVLPALDVFPGADPLLGLCVFLVAQDFTGLRIVRTDLEDVADHVEGPGEEADLHAADSQLDQLDALLLVGRFQPREQGLAVLFVFIRVAFLLGFLDLLLNVLEPRIAGVELLDPVCQSGGLLLETLERGPVRYPDEVAAVLVLDLPGAFSEGRLNLLVTAEAGLRGPFSLAVGCGGNKQDGGQDERKDRHGPAAGRFSVIHGFLRRGRSCYRLYFFDLFFFTRVNFLRKPATSLLNRLDSSQNGMQEE